MPSSINPFGSPRSMIPPTPESDITASPQSPRQISDPTNSNLIDQQPLIPQKRKAGRKPLYKTAQERRDRNRRAQLAFRARRSDYLARLEDTCRSLENVVVELQESNRTANDALARERSKVKYLENMIRSSQRSLSAFPSNPAITIPTADNDTLSVSAGHRVSFPLFLQEHSLITLEQQFSPATSTSQNFQTPNKMAFSENYLGESSGFQPIQTCPNAISDPFCQEALETPHSIDTTIEYSPSASSPFPIKEPGFLGNLDVPSLATGRKYE